MIFNKRGETTGLQFNWVFVFAVGALLLLFFFSIVQSQKEAAEVRLNSAILTDLNNIISSISTTERTTELLEVPDIEMYVDCHNFALGAVNKQFQKRIVFSPFFVKGKNLLLWSLEWKVPFKVSNFVYMTSPELKYYIVYSEPQDLLKAEKLFAKLPPETIRKKGIDEVAFNKEIISAEDIIRYHETPFENNYFVRFIFINTDPVLPRSFNVLEDTRVSAVTIPDPTRDRGWVDFYQKNSTGFKKLSDVSLGYFGEESLFGAVFTDDPDNYRCIFRKGLQKLEIVGEVYKHRTELVAKSYEEARDAFCRNFHDPEVLGDLVSIARDPNKVNTQLIGLVDQLKSNNRKAQMSSCASLY